MAEGNLLEIYYDRVISSQLVTLYESNCQDYGYVATKKTIDGVEYTVFYKQGTSEEEYIKPEIANGIAITQITHNITKRYTHIAPSCSKYKIDFADVDKEGSGRNSLTGQMYRERIGSYMKLELAWDLIPNSKEYNNWYKILTHLPPSFFCKLLLPNGEIQEKEFYRGDISTTLYLFIKDRQIWNGLSTTFTQMNLDEYNDTLEYTVQYTIKNNITNEEIVVYDYEWEDYYSKFEEWVQV